MTRQIYFRSVYRSIWGGAWSLALLAVVACQGSSSPTEPLATVASAEAMTIATRLGTLHVISHDCPGTFDPERIENELYTTANVAMKENPGLAVYEQYVLNGFEIHCRPPEQTSQYCGPHGLACFTNQRGGGQMHVWCDGGGVEHEAAHAIAYAAGLPCWRDVYHGVNFRCERG